MRFWDSSALLPLFVAQATSKDVRSWVEDDADIAVWTLTDVELRSALTRLGREARITLQEVQDATHRVNEFCARIHVIGLEEGIKLRAKRLLGLHALRAADALQLAAALIWCADTPDGYELVTLDQRIADTARREGFSVRP